VTRTSAQFILDVAARIPVTPTTFLETKYTIGPEIRNKELREAVDYDNLMWM
jgi:hypothetical protein